MKTPITDKYKGRWATHFPEGVTIYDIARRLELDRAALMGALEELIDTSEHSSSFCGIHHTAQYTLSAARANFPDEN